ncbi:MAG: MFS transporter [Ornithinimicrobium sp.]
MTPSQPALFTPAFLGLTLAELAYFTAFGLTVYTLPLFVTGPVGSDTAGAGLAFGVFAVAALVCRPYAGRLSDQWGRKPFLVGGSVLCALSLVMLGSVDSFAVVLLLRAVQGVGEAAFFVAGFAMLADIAPAERLGEALSYNSLGLYLGLVLGPAVGEAVMRWSGFQAVWWAGAALCVVAAVVVSRLPEAPRIEAGEPGALIHWAAIPVSLGFCAVLAAAGGFLAFAALRAEQVGSSPTSLVLVLYGAVVVVCRIAFAKMTDRFPSLPLAGVSLAVITAGLAAMAASTHPVGLLLGATLLAAGVAFATPAFFAAIFATAGPRQRGAAAGTASIFMDLGLGLGPVLLGFVAAATGIPWAFAAAAGLAAAGALWTAYLTRQPR